MSSKEKKAKGGKVEAIPTTTRPSFLPSHPPPLPSLPSSRPSAPPIQPGRRHNPSRCRIKLLLRSYRRQRSRSRREQRRTSRTNLMFTISEGLERESESLVFSSCILGYRGSRGGVKGAGWEVWIRVGEKGREEGKLRLVRLHHSFTSGSIIQHAESLIDDTPPRHAGRSSDPLCPKETALDLRTSS